jgi:methylmalonyl-CoA epimerase
MTAPAAIRAVLDHVGIAVSDLDAALSFYRDALGLEIDASEEVRSQRVRAHFIPLGQGKLEILEATAADSPVARFVEKRGAGLHHVALRVDDIRAALAHLKARGVRLVDEEPRPGAEGALVAFIHPSSVHGVLVELKEARPAPPAPPAVPALPAISRYTVGDLELISLSDGFFRLDGGSMFGVVPRPLWAPKAPPDGRNRITLAMRPLVVRGVRTMLIDAGLGGKENDRFHDIYGVDRRYSLDDALADAGLSVRDIDIVLATHLHFDHAGGFTTRDEAGRLGPAFPRARYIVRRGEWEDATRPHERNRASYLPENFTPLADAGVLELVDDDQTIMPGVRVRRTGGHTMHHQMVWIESRGQHAAYAGDLVPTAAHLPDAWIMGFDLYPVDTLAAKKAFVKEAIDRQALVFFPHDPAMAAAYIAETHGKRSVQRP